MPESSRFLPLLADGMALSDTEFEGYLRYRLTTDRLKQGGASASATQATIVKP